MTELSPEERRRIYEEEKTRLEARMQLESEARAARTRAGAKRSIWIGLIGIFLLIIAYTSLPDAPEDARRQMQDISDRSSTAVAITPAVAATQLLASYDANEIAADTIYKDRWWKITGEVKDVGKDIIGSPYVLLAAGELWGVQCMFPRGAEGRLASLVKRQDVALRCKVSGKMGNVLARECAID